jgi:hypothetical protein
MTRFMKYPLIALCLIFGAVSVCKAQNPNKTSPENCEQNSADLDNMRSVAEGGSGKDSLVIAIARLGNGETSRELNRRRLHNLRVHWGDYGLPAERLVFAEGERVNGYGRIEIYVSGKLFDIFLVERGRDFCVDCCGPDDRLYPDRVRKRRRR